MEQDALFITLTVPGEPKSKARPRYTTRAGKVVAYTPKDTRTAEARYRSAYLEQAKRINTDKLGAYAVHADFYNGNYQRRDVDNMLKAVLDGLNRVAWDDDAQVVEVIGRKHFVPKDQARAEVRIYHRGTLRHTNIKCRHCGKEFKTYPSTKGAQRYCSQECHLAKRKKDRTRTCEQCGTEFESHGMKRPAKFCSRACAAEARRTTKECTVCSTEFSVQQCHAARALYCSDPCRNKATVARRRVSKRYPGTCRICGGGTTRKEYTRCQPCKTAQEKTVGRPTITTEKGTP